MFRPTWILLSAPLLAAPAARAEAPAPPPACPSRPSLTLYTGGFGLVREPLALVLAAGENALAFSEVTAQLEPDSLVLRPYAGSPAFRVLEQGYRNDPVTQGYLLSLYEGQTIRFLRGLDDVVEGRVVRAGYVPELRGWMASWGSPQSQPIVEVDGELRFGLPGQPLFPALGEDTVLEPRLEWRIAAESAGTLTGEIAYLSGGFSWQADYNLVSAEDDDALEIVGWVTLQNASGRTFRDADLQLLAGDVARVQDRRELDGRALRELSYMADSSLGIAERSFDEFHLYTLPRPTTLRDRESKQVQFLAAAAVPSRVVYVLDASPYYHPGADHRFDDSWGASVDAKIEVWREFENAEAHGLGVALPKGRLRFYRREASGRLQFTGEAALDHTPREETVRARTGYAFDLVSERTRVAYHSDQNRNTITETFEIDLRNRKLDRDATVRVVERLSRWSNCELRDASHPFRMLDAQTAEFEVPVPADGSAVVRYTVVYTW
ncbi:MAG TPA: hypothetical protein VJP77_06520 [Planctomycetota bacterium]|nr:hypothetical protein [Planctomycetota bacterium]